MSKKRKYIKLRNVMLTFYNYDLEKLNEKFSDKSKVKCYAYQEEVCPKTSKLHIQAYCEFKNPRTMGGIKKYFGDKTVHIEKRIGTKKQAIQYCTKTETRKPGTGHFAYNVNIKGGSRIELDAYIIKFINGEITNKEFRYKYPKYWLQNKSRLVEEKIENIMDSRLEKRKEKVLSMKLYDWQKQVVALFTAQAYGKVLWIWDKAGQCGKSTVADYIMFTQKDVYFVDGGRWQDIIYAYSGQQNVIYDYSRSQVTEDFISYVSMEKLLNGRSSSSKYKSKVLFFGYNKILVFANYPPKWENLSKTRWLVYEVVNDKLNRTHYPDIITQGGMFNSNSKDILYTKSNMERYKEFEDSNISTKNYINKMFKSKK